MIKAIALADGREVRVCVHDVPGRCAVDWVELRIAGAPVGALVRTEAGEFQPADPRRWLTAQGVGRAAAYFLGRQPDLAGEPVDIARRGMEREAADLAPIIERAGETAGALDQLAPGPYVAVDADGRIYAIGETAYDAIDAAEQRGWEGWYSRIRTSDDTLWITPANNVRVKL
jgi:hypothetical protein